MKKEIIIIISLIFLFISPATVFSAVTIDNSPNRPTSQKVADSNCDGKAYSTCWNSEAVGVTNCGQPCTQGETSPWTRYNYDSCYVDPDVFGGYIAWIPREANACSTGDKDNSNTYNDPAINGTGDLSILRAGFCSCDVGGPYKTCCSGTTPVSANSFAVDPYDPLEGGCGVNTIVFCGGAGQPACGAAACGGLTTCTVGADCTNSSIGCQGKVTACPTGPSGPPTCECKYSCSGPNQTCVNDAAGTKATSNCDNVCPTPLPTGTVCNSPNVWTCSDSSCIAVNTPTGYNCMNPSTGAYCSGGSCSAPQVCTPNQTRCSTTICSVQ